MLGFDEIHSWVRDLPIVDWHNHLDLRVLAADAPLGSLYEVWVKTDPYKHRALRICGEREDLITGDSDENARWAAWMRTLPRLVGNPLMIWAKMELSFLGLDPAPYLAGRGENVSLSEWTPYRLLRAFNVAWMSPCLTAREMLEGSLPQHSPGGLAAPVVVPSLRLNAGEEIPVAALVRFRDAGCRVVDVSVDDTTKLSSLFGTLLPVAKFASEQGWTMLLHMGALRETSARLRAASGPVGGFAGMRGPVDPIDVSRFLNALESADALPRTVLLTLNPEAHAPLAVLAGSFNAAGCPGKVQLGPAWWWCDHEEGIVDVLEKNAAYGVLSTFVGMTTDSRSLLSFVRHGYFRRIVSRWAADKVALGAFPDDADLLRPLMEGICYRNAARLQIA